jgi:hypothetical protein
MTDENSQVKISDSGTYVVTGQSSDGNITVKKGATGVVLVLDDLDLTSTTGATVAVNKEAQVRIVISGNVTLTDAENPDDENSTDAEVADAFDGAAMKFKANSQVYLTGTGVLNINGSAKNGIKTGDDSSLIIDGGVTVGAQVGMSPWRSDNMYSNEKFAVTNISLKIDKEWEFDHFSLNLFAQGSLNPNGLVTDKNLEEYNIYINKAGDEKLYLQKLNGVVGLGIWF